MSKRFGNKNKNDEEPTKISQRIVQYVDDPKNSSALAKIHEMSNKAKRTGKSPAQFRRSYFIPKIEEPIIEKNEKNEKNEPNKKNPIFQRRSVHYSTVKPNMTLLNKNLRNSEKVSGKKEFVWDKSINRLVEKSDNPNPNPKIEKKEEKPKPSRIERKVEPQPKRQYQKETEPIKEDKDKEEKNEIIERLKEYRKNKENDGNKKRISVKVPKGNEKYSEIVYEKKVLKDDEDEDDFEKDSKNTKYYKKIVKNEPGSKVVITKKVIEENYEQKDDKLEFDNDSSDEEDIRKELKKLKINPSDLSKGNVKVKIITEEYDEKGNKVYSKEVTTNKLPKGIKGNNEIMDEFEKFEEEFDE